MFMCKLNNSVCAVVDHWSAELVYDKSLLWFLSNCGLWILSVAPDFTLHLPYIMWTSEPLARRGCVI